MTLAEIARQYVPGDIGPPKQFKRRMTSPDTVYMFVGRMGRIKEVVGGVIIGNASLSAEDLYASDWEINK